MGKKSFFLGEVGQAARMKLVVNMIMGGMMAAFCEGMALGQQRGLDGDRSWRFSMTERWPTRCSR